MTRQPRIAVVDYGIGNLRSAEKALQHVGADARLTSAVADIEVADGIVVPGVGAFGRCLDALRARGLDVVVADSARRARDADGVPYLGICVGMQMLFDRSDEAPEVAGLGIFPGKVVALSSSVKRPQMQWNQVSFTDPGHWLWTGLPENPWLYFVHTYMAPDAPVISAHSQYGGDVASALCCGKLVATQFHPEKSGSNGLKILSNFTDACGR